MPEARHPWMAPTATGAVRATVRLPGSKAMTARALVLSATSTGTSMLRRPLRAWDTELLASGLRALGTQVSTASDEHWVVRPHTLRGPAAIHVAVSGTAMRFLPPVAGLATGPVAFDGRPRARERPLGPLVGALRTLGVRVDSADSGGLPLTVHGTGRVRGGEVTIDASASSQLVSGLLLCAAAFERGIVVRHAGAPMPSAPHARMTVEMLRAAGAAVDDATPDVWTLAPGRLSGRGWDIEPDLSGAAPFLAAALVTGGTVTIPGWPHHTTQPGDRLRGILTAMGGTCALTTAGLRVRGNGVVHGLRADLSDVGELTPALAALAALADSPTTITGVRHIRAHETDRVAALARELAGLGARVTEREDGLEIRPAPLHGGRFETYDDHRMAHAGAVLGLAVGGVELSDAACTSKTMPGFPALWEAMVRGEAAEVGTWIRVEGDGAGGLPGRVAPSQEGTAR